MYTNGWSWADLNESQLEMLFQGEQTLGADILLAYRPSGPDAVEKGIISRSKLNPAPLNESQLECLQGLESKIQAVVVAYQHTEFP